MPRNGSGIYTKPFPDVVEGTTIESAVHNGTVSDIEIDLNAARPIIAGGTGATSAKAARDNLDTSVALQIVTNYDSHVWENGTFASAPGATNAPVASHYFAGTFIGNEIASIIEAYDLTEPHNFYVRHRDGTVWGAWMHTGSGQFVELAGDTMTGNLEITGLQPSLILSKAGVGSFNAIYGKHTASNRWIMTLGDSTAETGSNAGSLFKLARCGDDGVAVDFPLSISRGDGKLVLSQDPSQPLGAATKQYVDTGVAGANTNAAAANTNANNRVAKAGDTMSGELAVGTPMGVNPGMGNTAGGISLLPSSGGLVFISRAGGGSLVVNTNSDGTNTFFNRSGVTVGSVSVNTTATAYNTSSSAELKEDLKSFDAGRIVDDTNVFDFKWKTTGERSYGILAQQAVKVYPAAVTHDEDADWWGVDYSKYVPVLLNELKALRARVAELEEKLNVKPA